MKTDLEEIGLKLTNQMSIQNDQIVGTIVEQQKLLLESLLKEKENNIKKHDSMIIEKMDTTAKINNYIKDVMNIHNSQRAYILVFHNHNENLSGVPFVKYSCKYEYFAPGLDPLEKNLKDMAFYSIAQVVKDVRNSDHQYVCYSDIDEFKNNNPAFCHYIDIEKTITIAVKAIYDKNNILIGLLVLDYKDADQLPQKINVTKLSIQSAELSQLINIRYKYM